MSAEDTMERVRFDDVQLFPREDMRNGVKESVDLAAGYLIEALAKQDDANNMGFNIVGRDDALGKAAEFERSAKIIGSVLDLNFNSPDIGDGWFSVIRTAAIEFLDAF